MSPTGQPSCSTSCSSCKPSMSGLRWEWHVEAAHFCFPETQPESQSCTIQNEVDEVFAWPTPQRCMKHAR